MPSFVYLKRLDEDGNPLTEEWEYMGTTEGVTFGNNDKESTEEETETG